MNIRTWITGGDRDPGYEESIIEYIDGRAQREVASVCESKDACLIAAAPDLLNALRELFHECEIEGLFARFPHFDPILRRAHTAIEKATNIARATSDDSHTDACANAPQYRTAACEPGYAE